MSPLRRDEKAGSHLRRTAQSVAGVTLGVVAVVMAAQGCRTITGVLRGDLRASDVARDIHGIARISRAASEANRAITPEDEYYLGRAVAANVLSRYQYSYYGYRALHAGGYVPPGLTQYVYNVGSVLAAAAEVSYSRGDRPPPLAGYHFAIIDTPEINAFAAPGGYIFVTAGMLRLARSEDELAAILAHEMAHVVRGHGVRVIKKARKMKVYKIMASEASAGVFGDYNAAAQFLTQAVSDIVGTMVTSGYSRKLEHEADWRAVRILWSAGYDPTALHRVLSVMSQLRVGSDAGFFSTHPPPSARMSYLRKILPKSHPPVPQVRVARFRAASLPVNQGQS